MKHDVDGRSGKMLTVSEIICDLLALAGSVIYCSVDIVVA